MSASGLSPGGRARLHDIMAGHIEQGELPGLVTIVSRRGETHGDAIGSQAMDGATPMAQDTIFRITSMTKPVTAVAAMILVEECRLRLDDPIDQFLPELSNRRVLRRPDAEVDDTVPADRQITLRDLLTFRLGSGVVMAPPEPTRSRQRSTISRSSTGLRCRPVRSTQTNRCVGSARCP